MVRIGRNEPCPCGSGKKYKQCCLTKDQTAAAVKGQSETQHQGLGGAPLWDDDPEDDMMKLVLASNAVADMIQDGKLDEAERAAHQLLKDFPDVHDGYDRLGMVHEARGNNKLAAEYYRKALAFIRGHRDLYSPEMEQVFVELIERLDPRPPS